jgi:hypothetical protein
MYINDTISLNSDQCMHKNVFMDYEAVFPPVKADGRFYSAESCKCRIAHQAPNKTEFNHTRQSEICRNHLLFDWRAILRLFSACSVKFNAVYHD